MGKDFTVVLATRVPITGNKTKSQGGPERTPEGDGVQDGPSPGRLDATVVTVSCPRGAFPGLQLWTERWSGLKVEAVRKSLLTKTT